MNACLHEFSHPCAVLNVVNVELHGNVKAVQKITPEHKSVLWGVDSMDPPYTNRHNALILKKNFSVLQKKKLQFKKFLFHPICMRVVDEYAKKKVFGNTLE